MITTRTPLRISFAGGGTDLASFYAREDEGGAVISTAIDRYVYICVNTKFGGGIRVSYSKTENVNHADEVEHPIVRECLRFFGIDNNIEIVSIADIPGEGTGLGSSSSFTVGLLHALAAYTGTKCTPGALARWACGIEIGQLKEPIGKQDQYAAAHGGTNIIRFRNDDTVEVYPSQISDHVARHLLLLYTGRTRSAKTILTEQNQITDDTRLDLLRRMRIQVDHMDTYLERGDIANVAQQMEFAWRMKKMLAQGISDPQIDAWYDAAMNAGALSGKLLGAGGGGFLLLIAPPSKHMQILAAVPELTITPIGIGADGSTVLFEEDRGY